MKTHCARVTALAILAPLFNEQPSGNLSEGLERHLPKVASKDQALVKELCYGLCRHYRYLRSIAQGLMEKPLKAKDNDIELLILLGLYQLEFMRIPDHAALHESVNACARLKKPWAKGLVNAVLRQFLRQRNTLLPALTPDIGVQSSHPDWLVDALRHDWPEHYQTILEANNQPAPLTLRVNCLKISRDAYQQQLSQAQLASQACPFAPDALSLETPVATQDLPGFAEGLCSVQDESAQLAAGLLQLENGQRVLDACAAPGGKTCHLLEQAHTLSEVVALDINPTRLQKVQDNLNRLQLQASLLSADATRNDWWDGQLFDRILLDAPCSATGIIRRHPDIKWLRRANDIPQLAEQQLQALRNLWPMLKPGGLLLYATCSVLKQENEAVVGRFLAEESSAQDQKIEADWGLACPVGRQILPKPGQQDGFYYACLRKCPP